MDQRVDRQFARCLKWSRAAVLPAMIVAGSLGVTPAISVAGEADAFTATGLKGRIIDSSALNTPGMVVVQTEDLAELLVMSANGRWVMRGQLYDTWTGRKIQSVAAIRDSAKRMPLDRLWPKLDQLGPIVLGTGPSDVMIWVDPAAGPSRQLLGQLAPLYVDYRFHVLPIPVLGETSEKQNRLLTCASDKDAVAEAVIAGTDIEHLEQDPMCDLAPAHSRLVTAQILGLQGVPVVIMRNGRFNNGVPREGLKAWLGGEQ